MRASAASLGLPRVLGLGTALVATIPTWLRYWERPESIVEARLAVWITALAVFVAGFWAATSVTIQHRGAFGCLTALALEIAAAMAMVVAIPNGLLGALLVVIAAQAAEILPTAAVVAVIALQTLVHGAALAGALGARAWTLAGVFAAFQGFALHAASVAGRERRARVDLARVNAELQDAQGRLSEQSRTQERLRLSRELHDVMGHHLTALSLSLEAARHAPLEQARELVERAHALNRRLLQDLRRVVSAARDEAAEDLAQSVAALTAGIDRPKVHLTIPEGFRIDDRERAGAAYRCAQEIVTNAVRHADAQNLWLVFESGSGSVRIRARDDGRGAAHVVPGVGLRGMRERIESLGGQLVLSSAPDRGFEVDALLPLRGDAP